MEKIGKRILFVCNDSNTVINFRKELILYLQKNDCKIFVVCGDDRRAEDITNLGVTFQLIKYDNRSTSISEFFRFKKELRKYIRSLNPEVVFNFQIKPNIVGSSAAKRCGVKNIYCMVEGLGNPFLARTLKEKIVRTIVINSYKKATRIAKKTFFINPNDLDAFLKHRIIKKEKAVLLTSIGIDTKKYNNSDEIPKDKSVIYLSRLLKNKGIYEYCEIARLVKKQRPDIIFDLYGEEGDIKIADIRSYLDNEIVNFCGYTHDAQKVISSHRILCTTSYREGMPRIILEAMTLKRPVVASNVIGNKDMVEDNVTGYLIDLKNKEEFARKIIELIDNENKLLEFGQNARKICVEKYGADKINDQIYNIINS